MNKIKKYFLIKRKNKEYKNYIHDHKINILKAFYEMISCENLEDIFSDSKVILELWQRALDHDDSKYKKEEFYAYRKNYFPINEQEKISNETAFEEAWKHHWENNRHHWQARQNDICENNKLTFQQKIDCLENIMDWLAVGYTVNDRPYQYYEENKDEIILHQPEKDFIEKIIYEGIDKDVY